MKQASLANLGSPLSFQERNRNSGILNLTQVDQFSTDPEVFLEIFCPRKMKHGNRGKKLFIAANAFFWWVPVLKKSQKNYFGGRSPPTPGVEKWCPAPYVRYGSRRSDRGNGSPNGEMPCLCGCTC